MPVSLSKLIFSDSAEMLIEHAPHPDLKLCIVIPAFAENDIESVIESLLQTDHATNEIEIIVLINQSIEVSSRHNLINEQAFESLRAFSSANLDIHVLYIHQIPEKIAGVGTARKLAMDEAVRRLSQVGKVDTGIIVNLDADCTVSKNYFIEIFAFYQQNKGVELVNIHFEHDLGTCQNEEEIAAITSYELHLRYYIEMQRWLKLPYAFQTIGSAFAVLAGAYQGIGGMSRRKAGEDFYFIHKFTKKGRAIDLNSCTVYPSSRASFRVPFGTGRAVGKILEDGNLFMTYDPESFVCIEQFIKFQDTLYGIKNTEWKSNLHPAVVTFLESQDIDSVLKNLSDNSKSLRTFRKAFYQWFDAFRLMKYLHFLRDNGFPYIPVNTAITRSGPILNIPNFMDDHKRLEYFRLRHKESNWNDEVSRIFLM